MQALGRQGRYQGAADAVQGTPSRRCPNVDQPHLKKSVTLCKGCCPFQVFCYFEPVFLSWLLQRGQIVITKSLVLTSADFFRHFSRLLICRNELQFTVIPG